MIACSRHVREVRPPSIPRLGADQRSLKDKHKFQEIWNSEQRAGLMAIQKERDDGNGPLIPISMFVHRLSALLHPPCAQAGQRCCRRTRVER